MKIIKCFIVIISLSLLAGCGKVDLQEGKNYFRMKQPAKAIESFTKAIKADPGEKEAYFFRGATYLAIGQLNQAVEDFAKAIELDPKYGEAYWNRGYCYANMRMDDKAIADYTESLKVGTKVESLVYQLRSGAYYRQGMFDEAEADIRKFLELNPGDQKAMAALQDIEKARSDPDFVPNSLKFRPINEQPEYGGIQPTPEMQRANERFIQEVTRSYGTKERAFEEALKVAWKIYEEGDYATAMKRFNQAWLLGGDNPEIFYGYSLILRKWGYDNEADEWEKKSASGGYVPVAPGSK